MPSGVEPDTFDGVRGTALLIGFGRFGQIVAQCLLAEGVDVTTIDNDPEMIESAGRFGFKVYYGDGERLDVLRAAGAANARLIAVCVDKEATADHIVDLVRSEFPAAALFVRSFDRRHTLRLLGRGVDFEIRETFESALVFGGRMLERLGLTAERAGGRRRIRAPPRPRSAGDPTGGRHFGRHRPPADAASPAGAAQPAAARDAAAGYRHPIRLRATVRRRHDP